GGAGVNELDYSARTTDVAVNLRTGKASGVGGKATSIQNVVGGSGDDLLVGDAADNYLFGGLGNDVMIGGGGADTIKGGGGRFNPGGSDLLIAGSTAYDMNPDALVVIWQEWSKSGHSYAERIATLRKGVGRTGIALNSDTVFLDAGASKLTGGQELD